MLLSTTESEWDLLLDTQDLKIGDSIEVEYSTDLNICKINSIVRDVFSYHIDRKNQYEKDLELLISLKKKKSYSQEANLREKELRNFIKTYNKENWEEYCNNVKDIIERYKEISTNKKNELIIGLTSKKNNFDKNLVERLNIIRKYLDIAKKYIEIDYIFYPPFEIGCDDCDQTVCEMSINNEKGVYVCDCGNIFGTVYSYESMHIDPEKIESSSKSSYDPRINFIKKLKNYQGIHTKRISDDFLDEIDKYAQEKYNLPPASEIRKMPPDKYGHRGEMTSVDLLKEILKETNNQMHFEDINPICYKLWGWVVPSIEHLVPKIYEDYMKTQEVYKRINSGRSSINAELRLYWHLRIAGHDCPIEDFKIPHSRNSRKRDSAIFKQMCEETGLEFFPII